MLSVLLDHCLPLLAADCTPETIADTGHLHCTLSTRLGLVLGSPCLASELAARMQQPGSVAYLQQALRVVAALPLYRSAAAATPRQFGQQHMGAAQLLAVLCAPGGSSRLAESTGREVAWRFVEAAPHIAAVLAALAADDGIEAWQLAQMCDGLAAAAAALLTRLPDISSDSQLAAWAAACGATVRLKPTLLELHERCQSASREFLQRAPLHLAGRLASLLDEVSGAFIYTGAKHAAPQAAAAANEQLVRQLWAVHTSMCRLVAWLAADPSGGRAEVLPGGSADGIVWLLQGFSSVRHILLMEAGCAIDEGILR